MQISRECVSIVALVDSFGLPYRVTDLDTPGVHSDGSRHYQDGTDGDGLAVDMAGPIPYALDRAGSKRAMLALCARLEPYEHLFYELICSHLPYSVKAGRRVPRYAVAAHWNHIHLSVNRGVFVGGALPIPEVHVVADDPNLPNIEGPLSFHPIFTSTGQGTGYYIFSTRTGEVHGHGPGAPYFGRSEDVTP